MSVTVSTADIRSANRRATLRLHEAAQRGDTLGPRATSFQPDQAWAVKRAAPPIPPAFAYVRLASGQG